jgi:hypothetical protein
MMIVWYLAARARVCLLTVVSVLVLPLTRSASSSEPFQRSGRAANCGSRPFNGRRSTVWSDALLITLF